jgi:DNA polymerase III subunit delta
VAVEKVSKKKEIQEVKNFLELSQKGLDKLPRIFLYVAQDSFEFDLVVDHYRSEYKKLGEPFESVVYVSEPGDQEKLFSELFNFSMFSSWKLVIVKSGSDFFKTILTPAKKEFFENFKRSIPNLSDKISLLIHYDSKELPAKMGTMFDNKYGLLKSRNFYHDERRKGLEDVLKAEKVSFENDALDEFIHRIPPHIGAYLKNVQKLKLLLNKKHFTNEDIHEILFPTNEFNPFQLVEFIFQNNRAEFYKEFHKMKAHEDSLAQILSFLTAFLNRLDEVRKAKILLQRFRTDQENDEFFRFLKMDSYSEARKRFVKNRLRREVSLFTDENLSLAYEIAIDLNLRSKTSSIKDERHFYFLSRFNQLFLRFSQ